MNRDDIVLAALAAGGAGASYSPVQVQKLFFLIDREASSLVGGPYFAFAPYDYGPFDSSVYLALDMLRMKGAAAILNSGSYRRYMLTEDGYKAGAAKLNDLAPHVRTYLQELADWVRTLSFNQLVAAIYNRYPDMKVNSVFEG